MRRWSTNRRREGQDYEALEDKRAILDSVIFSVLFSLSFLYRDLCKRNVLLAFSRLGYRSSCVPG